MPGGEISAPYGPLQGNRQRIPFWMVQAYDVPGPDPASSDFEEDPRMRELHTDRLEEGKDIPLLLDDSLYQEGGSSGDEPFVPEPVSGKRWKNRAGTVGPRRPKRWFRYAILAALGFGLLLLLWNLGLRGMVQKAGNLSRTIGAWLPSNDTEDGGLNFSHYNSDFVQRKAGKAPLFVIEGKVTNNHAKPCHSIQVKGVLFNERGKRSDEETAYCGNILTKKELASASEESIRKRLQNPVGSNLSNFNIPPGKLIPFMLVFFDPPEKLSEFSIEIAGYTLQETASERTGRSVPRHGNRSQGTCSKIVSENRTS